MIRHITLKELNEIKEKYNHKSHDHALENVFLFNPGGGLLNPKAYQLCKVCGELLQIKIAKELRKEIQTIIAKKVTKLNQLNTLQ